MSLLVSILGLALLYLAYRIIRNGFARPQSERLNVFGVIGCILILIVIYSLAERFF